MKFVLIETTPIGVVLLIIIFTVKLHFALKEKYGIENQRIGENSLPTLIFRTIKIQDSMQKSEKMFSFGSSSNNLRFDCDFDGLNKALTFGEKGV